MNTDPNQPTPENDYTLSLYLFDRPGGYNWWEFDLYYIDQQPDALGSGAGLRQFVADLLDTWSE